MIALLIQWLLYAVALLIVSKIVPGFTVTGLWPAMIAALVIGLLNATVGFFLKIITFPLSIVTLGVFLLVINALMILLASSIVRGFHVRGFLPAFIGASRWPCWAWPSAQLPKRASILCQKFVGVIPSERGPKRFSVWGW